MSSYKKTSRRALVLKPLLFPSLQANCQGHHLVRHELLGLLTLTCLELSKTSDKPPPAPLGFSRCKLQALLSPEFPRAIVFVLVQGTLSSCYLALAAGGRNLSQDLVLLFLVHILSSAEISLDF